MKIKKFLNYKLLSVFLLILTSCGSNGQENASKTPSQTVSKTLPISIPDSLIKPLRTLIDSSLQLSLERAINNNSKWRSLASRKKIGIGLVDLRDEKNVKFARINGSEMMYAASLPKIAILLAAMDAIEKEELKETEEIKNDLRLMIGKSDNAASTRMIDLLGYDKIENTLTDSIYGLYDEEYGGGLWVGKRYAKTGDKHPDPIKGLSHAASATQVCRFYYLLVFGKLVNYERSKQMLDIMTNPKLHHKFVNTLEKIAPKAKFFRKSGTWRNYHSDSVLVWGPKRKYILVALIEDEGGEQILRQLALVVDNLLKVKE
ncbi:MAG: serine hydrolase [Bacteroidota bacterium]